MTQPVGKPTIADLLQAFLKVAIGGSWPNDTSAAYPTSLSGIGSGGDSTLPLSDTISANGTTTANHTAGMLVATIDVPDPGVYFVWVQLASAGGTVANTDMVNYELRVDGVSTWKPLASIAASMSVMTGYLTFDGTETLTVNCIGSGTNLVRVAAAINLTRVG